jgi:hypothetical protein
VTNLREGRVFRTVVLPEQDLRIAGAQAVRVELAGAEVVVLVEVGGQALDREEPHLKRDQDDGDRR